jgi:gamma-glutamylcyclotransferase (GGCT)/AIG2-like uncharacterized protein YtfP
MHRIMPETSRTTSTDRLFFVYGTLRRGDDNDITRLQPAPRWVAHASIAGTMYHLGAYPGVTLGGQGTVVGEIYAVSEALERKLDAIESEYPAQNDEYFKREIDIPINGQSLHCFVYEINSKYIAGKPLIASGDWCKNR